ncbi:MAG: metallopeptidase family protein [Parvularculaceae bacterium]|nr:metallopeptidase family protein [Parvularculaceae bacterium]
MSNFWEDRTAPGFEDFDALARGVFESLPLQVRALCGNILIHIADFADADVLADLEIKDPFELTGLYEGADIVRQSIDDIAREPNHVHLYRQPILAEWIDEGDIALGALIRHVLVHEIGHHFGLSDDDIHRIEREAP